APRAPRRRPCAAAERQPLLPARVARRVAECFNLGYEVLLQVLTRFFTHTDETDEQLRSLVESAFGLMAGVMRPLAGALTAMPAGPEHPGRTAGPTFKMYYQMGNFVPWREAALAMISVLLSVPSSSCAPA